MAHCVCLALQKNEPPVAPVMDENTSAVSLEMSVESNPVVSV